MIRCKKCNTINDFDRVLCFSCGEKLDFNDPALIENTINEKQENVLIKPKYKVKLKKESFTTNLIYIFSLFLFFLSVFFMFSASNVPAPQFSSISINTLNEKLNNLNTNNNSEYFLLSTDEINIYIERILAPLRKDIKSSYPIFFILDRIILNIKNSKINLFIIFKVFKRNLVIRLHGDLLIKDKNISIHTSKCFIGELLMPKSIINLLLKNTINVFNKNNSFKIHPSISSIKVENKKLIIFTKNPEMNSNETSKQNSGNNYDIKIPEDVLLVQAADTFLNQVNYRLALKYFTLLKIKFPKSPFKPHAIKQIKICQEKI